MTAEIIAIDGSWRRVADVANETVGRVAGTREPTLAWKRKILASEHSPIRIMSVYARFTDIPYFVSTHLVRHHIGIEKWVKTQRTDRTGVDRSEIPQGALVDMSIYLNLQAIINISRKRCCDGASKETNQIWELFLKELYKQMPEMKPFCLRECEYRGGCTETFSPCGFMEMKKFNFGEE